jgi:hypothetical protein
MPKTLTSACLALTIVDVGSESVRAWSNIRPTSAVARSRGAGLTIARGCAAAGSAAPAPGLLLMHGTRS